LCSGDTLSHGKTNRSNWKYRYIILLLSKIPIEMRGNLGYVSRAVPCSKRAVETPGKPRVICQSGIGEEEEEEKVLKSRGMCAEGRPL
jgi:hypothetical protein